MKRKVLLLCLVFIIYHNAFGKKKIIIDADTANEVDDIVAIARALMSENVEVIGLTAAQWNYQKSWMLNTVEESWKLNNTILRIMGREDIPSLIGSELALGEQWEGFEIFTGKSKIKPRPSEASDFIIKKALEMPEGERVTILVMGPLTNIASAILMEPSIATKISLHFLGAIYDLERDIWNKNEFNVRNDLNALDIVLNTPDLELHIMPVNVTSNLAFKNKSSMARLEDIGGASALILEYWKKMVPEPNDDWGWIMWDLALIHAIINPCWVEKKYTSPPPENLQRMIMVYTWIDHEKMKEDFWTYFTNKL